MKFHQLPLGAVFRYRDVIWRKISPLEAADEAGGAQRLIPRSAAVSLIDEAGEPVAERLPDQLPGERVGVALDELVMACTEAANLLDPPLSAVQLDQLRQAIAAVARDVRARLALER